MHYKKLPLEMFVVHEAYSDMEISNANLRKSPILYFNTTCSMIMFNDYSSN